MVSCKVCGCTKTNKLQKRTKLFIVKPEVLDTTYVNVIDKAKRRSKERSKNMSIDWEKVIKKSSIQSDHINIPEQEIVEKPEYTFCTGSKYEGEWDQLELAGLGRYTLFNDVCYEGHIRDNEYNGFGTLRYPMGNEMTGLFVNGRLLSHYDYRFADGKYLERYCEMPDRRYYEEIKNGLQAAGRSNKTNSVPTRDIPNGMYDAGDGFYDPITKCVYDPEDRKHILRIPTKDEHNWILAHCRKAWDEPVGFRPDLYENWYPKVSPRFSEYHFSDQMVAEQWEMLEDKINGLSDRISSGTKTLPSEKMSKPELQRVNEPVSINSRSESRKKKLKLLQHIKDDKTGNISISWKLDHSDGEMSDYVYYINASDLDLDSLEPLAKRDSLIRQDTPDDTPNIADRSRTLSTLSKIPEIII